MGNRVTVGGGCHLLGTITPCVCTSRKEELALRVVGHFSAALESPARGSVHVPKGLILLAALSPHVVVRSANRLTQAKCFVRF